MSYFTCRVIAAIAVDKARGGLTSGPEDDLDDPWGRGDAYFSRVADEVQATVVPLASALLGR